MPKVINISQPKNVSMSDDYYEMADISHFWIQWRFNVVIKQLKPFLSPESKILEIGCGNGVVMSQFEKILGYPIDGCDLNQFATNNLIANVSGNVYLYDIYDEHIDLLNKYDVIILFDVIEHIQNDSEFLNKALRHLKKNGLLVISVPAHNFLYSKFDKEVGHIRRYNKSIMSEVLKKTEAQIIKMNYWGLFMYPLVLFRKYYINLFNKSVSVEKGFKPPNEMINKIMKLIMKFETKSISKPFSGASLMAIARKE